MHKPVKIKPLENYKIWILYSDGIQGVVDLSHLAGKGVFSQWNDYENFKKVSIGSVGELKWNDEIDLCPDSLYMTLTNTTLEQLFPALNQ